MPEKNGWAELRLGWATPLRHRPAHASCAPLAHLLSLALFTLSSRHVTGDAVPTARLAAEPAESVPCLRYGGTLEARWQHGGQQAGLPIDSML